MNKVNVSVPATTANIGVGFDCLGAALTMANEFQFTVLDSSDNKLKIVVSGAEAYKVGAGENNLLYRALVHLYQQIGQTPPNLEITIELGVPLSRGLGSSATAIVGGLLGANKLAGNPLSQSEIMAMAIAIEGHPDNVVPALLGNCLLSVEAGEWQISSIPWHQDIIPVVAIPNFELSTKEARSVLPQVYSRNDAIFNISRMGLLIRALETNNGEWLKTALADKLHQPYRQQLITGYQQVKQAAISAGAYGMVISGAGPTLLALTEPKQVEQVIDSMTDAWANIGIESQVRSLEIDTVGARVW